MLRRKFILETAHFEFSLVYFLPHEGPGFSITTDKTRAWVITGKKSARREAERVQAESGMLVKIRPV